MPRFMGHEGSPFASKLQDFPQLLVEPLVVEALVDVRVSGFADLRAYPRHLGLEPADRRVLGLGRIAESAHAISVSR